MQIFRSKVHVKSTKNANKINKTIAVINGNGTDCNVTQVHILKNAIQVMFFTQHVCLKSKLASVIYSKR